MRGLRLLAILAAALAGALVLSLAYPAFREAIRGTPLEIRLLRIQHWPRGLLRPAVDCSAARSGSPTTNVVLIAIDTIRADHLGLYGYPHPVSPALDGLAAHSVVFQNAIASAPWTTPSFAALLTGHHPAALGIEDAPVPLPPEATSLAQKLCATGYQTAGVVSHSYVGMDYGFDRGFERWDESSIGGHDYVSSAHVTQTALAFLERIEPDRPFFLFAHYFDPHYRYVAHPRFLRPREHEPAAGGPALEIAELRRLAVSDSLDEATRGALIDAYDSELAFTDHHVGRLLEDLQRRGLYDDALVVLVGDHGEMFAEGAARWIGHTRFVFQSLIRVPLLLKLPRARSREDVARAVSTRDVPATILDVIGHEAADRDRSLLAARGRDPEPVFSQTRRDARSDAVIRGRWKLIRDETSGELSLYDLQRDPGEARDVAALHPEQAAALEAEILGWLDELARGRRGFSRTERPVISDEEAQRLRSLGYVE